MSTLLKFIVHAYNNSISCKLTFARVHAIEPRVLKLRVAGVSAFVEPSASAKTAAAFAGGLMGAALGTCVRGRRGDTYFGHMHIHRTHRETVSKKKQIR